MRRKNCFFERAFFEVKGKEEFPGFCVLAEDCFHEFREEPAEGSFFEGLSVAQFAICNGIFTAVQDVYEIKIKTEDADNLASSERYTILTAVDRLWREHLYEMDGLRQSVHLRSYGQKDPLVEYKTESLDMFVRLMTNIDEGRCQETLNS